MKIDQMKTKITQRKFCVNLLENTKRNYFGNLYLKNISDYRKFWKTIKHEALLQQ